MQKSALTIEDLLSIEGRGAWQPQLAPDGQSIVYEDQGALWLVAVQGGAPERLTDGSSPRWSPGTTDLGFLRGNPGQIWLRDREGRERQLTQAPQPIWDFTWSADGLRIALLCSRNAPAEARTGPEVDTIVEVHHKPLSPGAALWVVEVGTGAMRLAAQSEPGVSWLYPAWSPIGDEIALVENAGQLTRGAEQLHLAVIDLMSGGVRYPIGRSRRQVSAPRWSPDGARIAFPYSPYDFVYPYRFACGIIPAAGGEVACYGADYFVESICWHPDGRRLYCRGGIGAIKPVLEIDTANGQVRRVTEGGMVTNLRISRDGNTLIGLCFSPTELPEAHLIPIGGQAPRKLSNVSALLEPFQLANTEIVHWDAPDGLTLDGLLLKPPDYVADRRYPIIVDLHGGPVEGGVALFNPCQHWLAGNGYLVFVPDYRSGQTYRWFGPPAYGGKADSPGDVEYDFPDIMSGVDWLVQAGVADPDRVGLYGHSYGAWLIAWTIGHTRRFQAAVWSAGRCDNIVSYGTSQVTGGNAVLAAGFGGRPWEAQETYRRLSPLTALHHARTPTLILHGERDMPAQAELFYTWLHQTGVETEFVLYKGEGHVIGKPEHRKDFWRRTLAWFDYHLRFK